MAEALLLGMLASVVQEVVMRLIERVKNVEGTDAVSGELKEFLNYLKQNSSLGISSSNGAKKILQDSLDEAKTELKKWESKNSGFFARSSDDRVKELHAIRQRVKTAISVATVRLVDDGNRKLNLVDRHVRDGNVKIDLVLKLLQDSNLLRKPPLNGHQGTTSPSIASIGTKETIKKKPSKPKATSTKVSSTGLGLHSKTAPSSSDGKDQHHSTKQPPLNGHQGTTSPSIAPIGTKETIKKKPSKPKATSTKVSSTGPASHSKTAPSSSDGKDQHHSTKQQPSTSTNDGRKSPASTSHRQGISSPLGLGAVGLSLPASSGTQHPSSRPPKPGATVGRASQTSKLTKPDKKQKRSVSLWQHLRAPMDSEKQAKDIKEKLESLEGVKEVQYDQPSHKVSVLLHEGSNVKFSALVEAAQLKDKVKPTAWEKQTK